MNLSQTRSYQRCTRCIMDTSDPDIIFDKMGICNHCANFDLMAKTQWFPDDRGIKKLEELIDRIKLIGRDAEYDCILGLSGGIDSSYLALKIKDWGLRPLVVHVDAGWNSELAVANIEKIVRYCGYDLHTHVVNWEEMRDLHLSYLKSGISNQDVPQDHIFFSSLYHFAIKNRIKYIFSGGNIATEGIVVNSWHGSAMDSINLRAIHNKYGELRLNHYKTISFFQCYFWYPLIKKMRTVRPLNLMPYNKDLAIKELEDSCGWRSYGRKHGESLFTKVFQNDYLPRKFGYDKRLPHLSSLIVSGQISREQAIKKLQEQLYDPAELNIDLDYFCKKLKITRADYEEFILSENNHYSNFKNWDRRYGFLKKIQFCLQKFIGRRIIFYS